MIGNGARPESAPVRRFGIEEVWLYDSRLNRIECPHQGRFVVRNSDKAACISTPSAVTFGKSERYGDISSSARAARRLPAHIRRAKPAVSTFGDGIGRLASTGRRRYRQITLPRSAYFAVEDFGVVLAFIRALSAGPGFDDQRSGLRDSARLTSVRISVVKRRQQSTTENPSCLCSSVIGIENVESGASGAAAPPSSSSSISKFTMVRLSAMSVEGSCRSMLHGYPARFEK